MTSRGRVSHARGVEEATHGHRMMLDDPEIRPHVGDQLGLIDRTLTPDRVGLDVVVEKLEILATEEMRNIIEGASEKIIDNDDIKAHLEKVIREMGTQKSGTTGNKYAHNYSQPGQAGIED